MTEPMNTAAGSPGLQGRWTGWLIVFLRVMSALSMAKGLFFWALVCGIGDGGGSTFEGAPVPWKAATIFFAVIDLVAAVGLWLAAAWGGVVWLTAAISFAAIEVLFPNIYGGRMWGAYAAVAAIIIYMALALAASRERPD